LRLLSLDQRFQIGGIASAVRLDPKSVAIGRVFVAVDGVAHVPQRPAEFLFLLALNGDARQGQRHHGENRQDGRCDD
jgi:hypothetical protein